MILSWYLKAAVGGQCGAAGAGTCIFYYLKACLYSARNLKPTVLNIGNSGGKTDQPIFTGEAPRCMKQAQPSTLHF